MRRSTRRFNNALLIFIALILVSCSNSKLSLPEGSEGPDVPLYPNATTVQLSNEDREMFIAGFLDYESNLLFENNTDIRVTEDIAKDVREKLDDLLPDNKWRLDIDWQTSNIEVEISYSQWKNGDMSLRIFIIDNLNSTIIDELTRRYGFPELAAGNTLIVSHVIDTGKTLPNMTATEETENRNATATVQTKSRYATSTAQKYSQQSTGTAQVMTSTAKAEIAHATATEQAAIQQVTATAVAQATRDYLEEQAQKLSLLSAENDFESSTLSSSWVIDREDPTRWDLTGRSGWLRMKTASDKDGKYVNIFTQDVSPLDMSVIVKMDIEMIDDFFADKFIIINLVSASSEENTEVTDIKLLNILSDYRINMRTYSCQNEKCGWADNLGVEALSDDMFPIYLKLTQYQSKVTGYYSTDGNNWSYLGEKNLKPGFHPHHVSIYAGKEYGTSVSTYVDFVHYELLDENGDIISVEPPISITSTSQEKPSEEDTSNTLTVTPSSDEDTPQTMPTEVTCGNALPSRINKYLEGYSGKHYAYVTPGGVANWMREKAGSGATEVDKIEPGEMVFIEQGPYCSEGKFWWYVQHRNTKNGRLYKGWTAEGDDEDYWLEPCVDENGNVSKFCDINE